MRMLGYFEIINPFFTALPLPGVEEFDDLQNQIF